MIQNGPWQIKERIEKYSNPWMQVYEDQVIRPDGKSGIVGTVSLKPGAAALPIDDEGYVYLFEEFHYSIKKTELVCATGGTDSLNDFDYLKTAKRELEEELGIKAGKWTDLGFINPLTMLVSSPMKIYLAQDLTFTKQHLDETEDIKIVKMKLEDAIEKIGTEITAAATCTLLLKTYLHLKRDE